MHRTAPTLPLFAWRGLGWAAALGALAACAPPAADEVDAPLPATVAGPPADLGLTFTAFVAGSPTTITVTGAPPGERVYLGLGRGGLGAGPCPATLGGRCLGIAGQASVLADRRADPTGTAVFTLTVPLNAPVSAVAIQAAVVRPTPLLSAPTPVWVHASTLGFQTTADRDGDGFTWATGDCNDGDATVRPGASDPPRDGADRDCDGLDGRDADGDGAFAGFGDCDDTNAAIRPGAAEVCDAVDQDCDGAPDDGLITDGAGCRVEVAPTPSPTASILHVSARTSTAANSGSDTVVMELCLSSNRCFPLGNPNYNDWELGALDVTIDEGVALSRASVDRVRWRLTGGGTDAWKPDCLQVTLDGLPLSCSAGPGAFFGSSAGEITDWTDPAGVALACTTCAPSTLTHGPYIGALTPTTARLWFRADATRRAQVRVVPDGGNLAAATPITVRYPRAERDFTETIDVSGLQPGATYDYRVTVDGGGTADGTFTTPTGGPEAFHMAFGSCSRDDAQPIFTAIDALDLDLFLFIGDNHYGNTADLSDLRQFYRWAHGRPDRDDMMRSTPILAVWDDHDYVGNNTSGASPGKENALRVFQEYWANPSYGTDTTPGIFSTWRRGEVEFFLLDDRYWRGLDNNILGDAQTAWLYDRLRASDATFKVLADGSVWSPETTGEIWGAYPAAYEELLAFIRDEAIGGVVLMSGDIHRSHLREVAGAPGGYTLPELVSSPLANTNAACENANSLRICGDSGNYFIDVTFDTRLADPTMTANLRDVNGAILETWTVLRSSLENPTPPAIAPRPDVDGDGDADLAIGLPGEAVGGVDEAGAVAVLLGSSMGLTAHEDQLWTQETAGVPGASEAGDHLGAAVVSGDFDGDGFDDVAWGSPDEAIGAATASGYLQVAYGSAAGLTSTGLQEWFQGHSGLSGTAEAGDHFGEALAVGDFDADGYDDLAVGVPDEDGWGQVTVLFGSAAGLSSVGAETFTQANTGSGSTNEAGDGFGAALGAGDFDGDGFADLAIGHPTEDLSGVVDAGMFTVVYGSAVGLSGGRDQEWHQDTANVPGAEETGDRMGSGFAAGDIDGDGRDELAVAAVGEAIGAATGSGYVIVWRGGAGGLSTTGILDFTLTNTARGLTAAAGDDLGAALAMCDVDGDGFEDLALGAPGRTVGADADAGGVLVLYSSGVTLTDADSTWIVQDPHPDTASEAGDRHGAALACGDHDADGDEDLAVGAPGEAIGAVGGAGMLMVYRGAPTGLSDTDATTWHQDKTNLEGVVETGDALGSALAPW
jgi:hypothetical protein